MLYSYPIRYLATGKYACFTRPESKVERVSYSVPTRSALRGVTESILFNPSCKVNILQCAILSPIKWQRMRRNEVKGVGSFNHANPDNPGYIISDGSQRTQRLSYILKDVSYVVDFQLTMESLPENRNLILQYEEMYIRRLKKGHCRRNPFFGCKENFATLHFFNEGFTPINSDSCEDLGNMFYDFNYDTPERVPMSFHATLDKGIIKYPTYEEVLALNTYKKDPLCNEDK